MHNFWHFLPVTLCSAAHVEETLSTLGYAARAKNIRNAPAVQVDPREAATAALRREVRILRAENAFLRDQLFHASLPREAGSTAASPAGAVGMQGAGFASPEALPAQSIMLPLPTPGAAAAGLSSSAAAGKDPGAATADLAWRLAEAQRLLGVLSNENSRLSSENDRLRAGGMLVASDYSGAIEEVDWVSLPCLQHLWLMRCCPSSAKRVCTWFCSPPHPALNKCSCAPSLPPWRPTFWVLDSICPQDRRRRHAARPAVQGCRGSRAAQAAWRGKARDSLLLTPQLVLESLGSLSLLQLPPQHCSSRRPSWRRYLGMMPQDTRVNTGRMQL